MKTKRTKLRKCVKNSKKLKRLAGMVIKISLAVILLMIAFKLCRSFYHGVINPRNYWNDDNISETITARAFSGSRFRLYNEESNRYTSKYLDWVSGYSNDTTLGVFATLDNKRGYFDTKSGEVVIPAEYDYAWAFSEGLAGVVKNGKIGFINADNEIVIPFMFDCPKPGYMLDYIFREGHCVINDLEGKCGAIDREGNWVLPQEYLYFEHHECQDGCWTLVDSIGNMGLLDAQMNWICPTQYDKIVVWGYPEFIDLVDEGRMWREDAQGNVLIDFMFEYLSELNYPESIDENNDVDYHISDYAAYRVNYDWGILNLKTGKPLTPAIYGEVTMISKYLFSVECSRTLHDYFIDLDGNTVSVSK